MRCILRCESMDPVASVPHNDQSIKEDIESSMPDWFSLLPSLSESMQFSLCAVRSLIDNKDTVKRQLSRVDR